MFPRISQALFRLVTVGAVCSVLLAQPNSLILPGSPVKGKRHQQSTLLNGEQIIFFTMLNISRFAKLNSLMILINEEIPAVENNFDN